MPAENPPNDLRIKFTVINPPHVKSTQFTGTRHEGMEVGDLGRLDMEGATGIVKWADPTPPNIVRVLKSDFTSLAIAAIGFGTVEITATDTGTKKSTTKILQIGSVVIVGADGKQWQFFADGSSKAVDDNNPVVQGLIATNAVVANLTGANLTGANLPDPEHKAPEPYVTCYVLNLKSFKFDP